MKQIFTKTIDTPIGSMLAIADEQWLYFLEFIDTRGFEKQIITLEKQTQSKCMAGISAPIASIEQELTAWFSGKLRKFTTPLQTFGTPFQQKIWEVLCSIPFGQTFSYSELAEKANQPLACRAAANANASNRFAIVIPCHRVIRQNGDSGGYAGGVDKKKWLIAHERKILGSGTSLFTL